MDFSETVQILFPWPEEDHVIQRSGLTAFYQSYSPLSVLASNSSYIYWGIWMKLSSYCCHGLKMIIFYWGLARLIFTRVIALWQFFESKSCLCNSFCIFQWILMIPSSYCSHDLKRIILYHSHAWLFFTRVMALAIITKEKLCQHNILRTALTKILIFCIWLRINVYMTWLISEQIPWQSYTPLWLWHYSYRKTLSAWYLENCLS